MKVSKDFILAVLFSEIGRLQKRAEEGIRGSVKEVSQRWLEQKELSDAAKALDTWGNLITKAAHLSLGIIEPTKADQQRLREDTGDLTRPLVSLFSKVPLQKKPGEDKEDQLPEKVSFLSLYPLNREYAYPQQDLRVSRDAYQDLWNRLNTEVDSNLEVDPNLTPDAALVLLDTYTACVPYLLPNLLPIGDDPRTDPFSDIALFDHLKMTAAIASCLYVCAMERASGQEEEAAKIELDGYEQAYLLVGGDFSGVQDFIYRISSQGALKAVRGRSFFLELLTQHVVAELLEATGCSQVNVLYAGGAQFSLLLPKAAEAERKIEKIRKEINTYLIQVHGGKLALILEYQECRDTDLLGKERKEQEQEGWAYARAALGSKIGARKKRKFTEFLQTDGLLDQHQNEAECRCCGTVTEVVKEEELTRWGLAGPLCRFCFLLVPKNPGEQYPQPLALISFSQSPQKCQWCKAEKELVWCQVGEEIIVGCRHPSCLGKMETGECQVCHRYTLLSPLPTPEVQAVTENKVSDVPEPILACPFCRNLYHLGEHLPELECVRRSEKPPSVQPRMIFNIGRWFYDFPPKAARLKESLRDDTKDRGWLVKEAREVSHYLVVRPVSPLPLGNYHPQVTEEERKWLRMTDGQKALDFSNLARASVGSHLIGVLRMDVDNLGELFTRRFLDKDLIPTRTSALSRLLTRFFTNFINTLCEGKGLPPNQREPFLLFPEGRPGRPSKKRWVTVVYSGGDDLFLVGAWSEVIELAFDIHAAFRNYVCDHPEITLSGGMIVQHEDFPLYQMASLAKGAEERAKENKHPLKMLIEPQSRTKDSFAPFYLSGQKAFFWDEAEKLRELATAMVTRLKDDQPPQRNQLQLKVPHAWLAQLFEIVEIYKREGKLYLPRLHYVLAHKDIHPDLRQRLLRLDTISSLYPALLWLELLSRREEAHARD